MRIPRAGVLVVTSGLGLERKERESIKKLKRDVAGYLVFVQVQMGRYYWEREIQIPMGEQSCVRLSLLLRGRALAAVGRFLQKRRRIAVAQHTKPRCCPPGCIERAGAAVELCRATATWYMADTSVYPARS